VLAPSGHDEWVGTARRVEDLGFSTLTVADQSLARFLDDVQPVKRSRVSRRLVS
jgi:hypothetical protein